MYKRNLTKKIYENLDNPEFIAIIGARQAGKTTLFEILRESLLDRDDVNSDQISSFTFQDPLILEEFNSDPVKFIKSRKSNNKKHYFFLDEYQYVQNAGAKLKLIYDTVKGVKLLITGSSSLEIKDIGSEMVGRIFSFELDRLSLNEILNLQDQSYFLYSKKYNQSFEVVKSFLDSDIIEMSNFPDQNYINQIKPIISNYIQFGGYPAVYRETDISKKQQVLQNIYSTYVEKDIIRILKIGETKKFFDIIRYLSITIGQLISYSSIQTDLNLSYDKTQKFIEALKFTFIVDEVRPFFKNKVSEIKKNPIFYFQDLGLRNWCVRNFNNLDTRQDSDFLLENYVYLRLKDYLKNLDKLTEIKFWRVNTGGEVDFIIDRQGDNPAYIPVEVKNKNLKNPVYGKALYSFIDSYKPPIAIIVNKNLLRLEEVNGTKVLFLPYGLI